MPNKLTEEMQKDEIKAMARQVKKDSHAMAALPIEVRNEALSKIAEILKKKEHSIFSANRMDLKQADEDGLPEPIIKRLNYDSDKNDDSVEGIKNLISLPDPLFHTLLKRELDQDLILQQVTCPIGVIGVIFESRPDALVQIAALCLKSGNCAILKGGSEAFNTNRILFELIREAALSASVPRGFLTLVESRSHISSLLKCDEDIDLLIPRGSNEFVQYIMDNSRIPVMGHADGVCHIYVDKNYDQEKALKVIVDAKTQYIAACNTIETLLVHESVAKCLLPPLADLLKEKGVTIKGTEKVQNLISCLPVNEEDWRTEYLDYILSIKIVSDLDDAISHINSYGSHHTDSILTEDPQAAMRFMLLVDSAGVYQNCSTRFADGFRYGFGAEVGISTGKLHARGPVGLEGLVTYKYRLFGKGQTVDEYASGEKSFHFRDLKK